MKKLLQSISALVLTAFILLSAGCSYQALTPGKMASSDELRPGEGVSSSGKIQQKTLSTDTKSGSNFRQEEASASSVPKDARVKAEGEKPRQKRTARSDKQESSEVEAKAPPFIPLDKIDISSLEESDGNATGITESGKGMVVNFDHAPLQEVILSLARILRIDYMFLTEPQGQVTINTTGTISRDELFPLFYQILEANGLTAVRDGGLYKIVAMKDAPRHLTSNQIQGGMDSSPARQDVSIRILPLQYIETGEMTKILTPFISAEGSIISHDQSNTLVVVDHPVNIKKAQRLIKAFDVNLFSDVQHAIIPVKYMESNTLADSIKKMLSFYQKKGPHKVEVIDLEKLNSLLILADSQPLFHKAQELIKELDRPGEESEPHIYIYFIKNSTAEDMAGLLNSIFSKSKAEPEKQTGNQPVAERKKDEAGNPFAQKTEEKKTTITMKAPITDFGSGTLRGQIKITSDEIRNALIIEALPSDYQVIKGVLERLDILPRQVLISVTLAEVQLDDGLDLGVEWSWTHNSNKNSPNNSTWSALVNGDVGLSYTIGQAEEWSAALSALAQKQKVDILSSPSVLASDNKEAQINISTEIPVASAQIRYDDDNTDRTQTDIQYRNTGVILNVTPHINENGLVSMEMNQEVSEQSDGVNVGGSTYPSFFKRSINTTLTVNNGQTIVIGGLIRENSSNSSNGVPFLSEIPILGWAFGTVGKGVSKSELIVLIKPTVVASLNDVDAVTSEFAQKVGYDL